MTRVLLVRVGADLTDAGGRWNGPFNRTTNAFVYVPIPESKSVRPGHERPFNLIESALNRFSQHLPSHLTNRAMHLDPDFEYLTYGDQGARAHRISKLKVGDYVAFYAGLRDITDRRLAYCLIGLIKIESFARARDVETSEWKQNAHTRRQFDETASDLIVRGDPRSSGRFQHCVPIGEWRNRSYRVRTDLLKIWGGLSNVDGYLQRSARLPEVNDGERFLEWLDRQSFELVRNNGYE